MLNPVKHNFLVDRNIEHLRLLGIYHLIIASAVALIGFLFYGLPMLFGSAFSPLAPPMKMMAMEASRVQLLGGLLVMGGQVLVLGLNGWCLRERRNWLSCVILSCFECLCAPPLGLLLGISAVLVLRREAVRAIFSMRNEKTADRNP